VWACGSGERQTDRHTDARDQYRIFALAKRLTQTKYTNAIESNATHSNRDNNHQFDTHFTEAM